MNDIHDRADVIVLIDAFYAKVVKDELLAPVFAHLDLPSHLPTMYNFWCSILFGDKSYEGNPFQKHIKLSIDSRHFGRWLELFRETVDQFFKGEKAEEVKNRATSIGGVFQHKMGLI